MEKISAIKGIKDILPQETPIWNHFESTARKIFGLFGFREIRVPIIEKTELFKRGIGETTDIVEKEMYTFHDRDDELITLRPEATAGVIRAYIEHNMQAHEQITKLFTIGPMFRRERPQKGRFRQFHQINVELFGEDRPQADAEIIFMLAYFLKSTGITNFSLEINSLGCRKCRPAFSRAVVAHLQGSEQSLCLNCQRRIKTNPLRVFDCKTETCQDIISHAPKILDYLCNECEQHFADVKSSLADLGISYQINPKMVRGLDYYIRTAFEVTSGTLGAQNAIAGGGRYDGLVSFLGGPEVAGIGFAAGMERLVACLEQKNDRPIKTDVYIAALGATALKKAFLLTNKLREAGISAEMNYSDKSLKSQMKRADKLNSSFTLILGDEEIEKNSVKLRDMNSKKQEILPLDKLPETLLNFLKEKGF
jgi:histidyl-tRNA synthetase